MLQKLIREATSEERDKVCAEIRNISRPNRSFYAMVAVSTIIAAFGLLSNSTAIVIGAMLVAPLMGPIFGVALGLSAGDRSLLRSSLTAEAVGVVISVLIAYLIGCLPLRADFGPEIISRTQPTIYDLVVAVASGVAGAYAMTNPRISPALPGVAISTSLVPPLAACGLSLSAARYDDVLGSFLLFAANFLAIELAAAAVFIALRICLLPLPKKGHYLEYCRRFGISIIALVAVSVFLTRTFLSTVESKQFSNAVQTELSSQLRTILGAQLDSFHIQKKQGKTGVVAVVLTPHEIDSNLVGHLEQGLHRRVDDTIRLIVRSIISSDADSKGPVFLADDERERQVEVQQQTAFLSSAGGVIRKELESIPGARLVDVRRESDGNTIITAVVRTPEEMGNHQVKDIEAKLSDALEERVRLVLRCIITRDVDSNGILYQKEPIPINTAQQALGKRLGQAMRHQLSLVEPRASLSQLRYGRINNKLHVLVSVRTPKAIAPHIVKRIEALLREHVESSIVLIVRFEVGADVATDGYLPSLDESKLKSSAPL